jgi:2-haloacid dehalogenase
VKLSDFEALSFDCYGTLIDWESGIAAVLTPWAAEHRIDLTEQELLEQYAIAEAAEEARTPDALYPRILAAAMRRLGGAISAPVGLADAERLARSVPAWPAFPDSAEALAVLAQRYKLIILSNVDRESFAASNLRLGVRFDAIVTAEEVGAYKPSARNFEVLLDTVRDLGVHHGALLHVAQSLFHDHVPARRMGLPTVWINRRLGRPGWGATPPPDVTVEPDWTFPSMAAFAEACVAAADP